MSLINYDADQHLFEHLRIVDLLNLSEVNKYYYQITKKNLDPFRLFHTSPINVDNIMIEMKAHYERYNLTYYELFDMTDKSAKIILKCIVFGNMNVLNYYLKNHDVLLWNVDYIIEFSIFIGFIDIFIRLQSVFYKKNPDISLLIATSASQIDIIKYIVKNHKIDRDTFATCFIIARDNNDNEIMSIIGNYYKYDLTDFFSTLAFFAK